MGGREFYRVSGLTIQANRELVQGGEFPGSKLHEVARRKEPHKSKFRVQILVPEHFRARLSSDSGFLRVSERHFQVISWLVKGEYWRKYCDPAHREEMEKKLETEQRLKLNQLILSDDWSHDEDDPISILQSILREKIDLVRGPRLNPRSRLARELEGQEEEIDYDAVLDPTVDPVKKYGFTKLEGE